MKEEVRADPEDELGGSSINMPEPQEPGKRGPPRTKPSNQNRPKVLIN